MARIPEEELEAIKRSIDLAALVRSRGIELKKHGSKDLAGLSPFTEEKTPSFIVTPGKNLWHCMSSGQGGSVIDFIMKYDGVSFRQAVELLREKNPALYRSSGPVKKSTVPKLPPPVEFDADDQTLFDQVLGYYAGRLRENPAAIDYLKKRGLWDEEALERFRIGYADRTLGLTLPHKNRKDGAAIRQRLTKLGLYRESGHEHFNGCLVWPIPKQPLPSVAPQGAKDGSDAPWSHGIAEIYGRKVGSQKSGIYHLYLPGPHSGIWNPDCFNVLSPSGARGEIILTESIIDALTFWVNGFQNVTCIWGTEGFTDEHLEAFRKHQTQKIYLAYDRDKAGDRAAERDAERLQAHGIECFRVKFPAGMDVNEYALAAGRQSGHCRRNLAGRSLGVLINSAEWLGKGRNVSECIKETATRASSSLVAKLAAEGSVSAEPEVPTSVGAEGHGDAAKEKKASDSPQLKAVGEDYVLELGERSYRVRGLQKNGSLEVLKINLRLVYEERFHLDTLDFYRAKDRESFIRAAAAETTLEPDLIKRDLGKLLLALEQVQEERIRAATEPQPSHPEMTGDEQAEALELLKSPDLLERILADFEACGIVGESTNKLTGYLACVSRKLDKPLAIIIQSTSAAGKSMLMESILAFIPEEERVKYSAMTGQSLYYLGETNLKNKILAIVEEEGAEKASYALKLLQSEGELTIASTGKDEQGRMKTEEYHVEGPVMIFLTTTAVDIDEELLNRCLVLTVDESREQTKAIHDLQREAETFEGLKRKVERERVLAVHRNAQRLLQPLPVVNPFAQRLTFLSDRTRTRRDHVKYLTLIRTIALLHQHQRPLREKDGLQYIEVTLEDLAAANRIAHEVLGRSLDELPPQTRRLLGMLETWVDSECEKRAIERGHFFFSRRRLREVFGWGDTQLKVHLARLVDMEYLLVHRNPDQWQGYVYELLYAGEGEDGSRFVTGLLDLDSLKHAYDGQRSGSGRGAVGRRSVGGQPPEKSAEPSKEKASGLNGSKLPQNAQEAPELRAVVS